MSYLSVGVAGLLKFRLWISRIRERLRAFLSFSSSLSGFSAIKEDEAVDDMEGPMMAAIRRVDGETSSTGVVGRRLPTKAAAGVTTGPSTDAMVLKNWMTYNYIT